MTGQQLLKSLASRRLTLAFFFLCAAAALAVGQNIATPTALIPVPLGLLVLNLLAAVLTQSRFRADAPLLVFHLALLALVVLFLIGRATYFYGAVSLTTGTAFAGKFEYVDEGPWYGGEARALRFEHLGFRQQVERVGLDPAIHSALRWSDGGRSRVSEISDGYPLLLDRYRLYVSARKGLSPVFLWTPEQGPAQRGTVQLAGSSIGQMRDTADWTLPNGETAWVMVQRGKTPVATVDRPVYNLGVVGLDHRLVLRIGADRHELRPGDTAALRGGSLTYERLDTWIGYRVAYDPTQPWLIATVLIAVVSLGWYYWRRFSAMPEAERG